MCMLSIGSYGDGGSATSAYLAYPLAISGDSVGNLFIADTNNHRIRRVDLGTQMIYTGKWIVYEFFA